MLNVNRRKFTKSKQWYLSLDTYDCSIKCWNATKTDVTKHYSCVEYRGNRSRRKFDVALHSDRCLEYFGHCPRRGGLIYVEKMPNGQWQMEPIDLAFSD